MSNHYSEEEVVAVATVRMRLSKTAVVIGTGMIEDAMCLWKENKELEPQEIFVLMEQVLKQLVEHYGLHTMNHVDLERLRKQLAGWKQIGFDISYTQEKIVDNDNLINFV